MTRSGRARTALVLIAVAAVVLRLGHAVSLLRGPIGEALVQDARFYHEQALRILGRLPQALGDTTPFNNLGYPYLLAAIYAVAGARPGAAMIVQAVLGGASTALLGLAIRDLAKDDLAAVAAAGAYAAAQTAIFYDGALLTPAAVDRALIAALAALARWSVTGRFRWIAWSGAALGVATLLRTNLVLAVPFAALAVLLPRREAEALRPRSLPAAALLVACALAGPAAVGAAVGVRAGAFVPLTANGGMNFWVGNNPDAQGVYYVAPFLRTGGAAAESDAYLEEARRRTGDPTLTLAGSSRFWLREGWRAIVSAPGRWLRLEGRKIALFATAAEPQTNLSLAVVSAFSPVLRATPVRFGILAVLGAGGLVLLAARGDRQAAAVLAAPLVAAFLTCAVFFVSGEYRHAAAPGLAGGAGVLVGALARPRRERRWAWMASGAAAIAAAVLAVLPWPGLSRAMPPDLDAGNLVRAVVAAGSAVGHADEGTYRRAEALLRQAPASEAGRLFRLDTRSWLTFRAAQDLGDRARAADALDAARELLASDLRALGAGYDEGFLLDIRSGGASRVKSLTALPAVSEDPSLARRAALLGAHDFVEATAALRDGRGEEARTFLEEAAALTPDRVEVQALLGKARLATGDRAGAIRALHAACAGWPVRPDCAFFAAEMYASEGNVPQARSALAEALRRDPTYGPALRLQQALR